MGGFAFDLPLPLPLLFAVYGTGLSVSMLASETAPASPFPLPPPPPPLLCLISDECCDDDDFDWRAILTWGLLLRRNDLRGEANEVGAAIGWPFKQSCGVAGRSGKPEIVEARVPSPSPLVLVRSLCLSFRDRRPKSM